MAKIIKIDNWEVTIVEDNGSFLTVPIETLSFKPEINDIVEVYKTETSYIINKAVNQSNYSNNQNSYKRSQDNYDPNLTLVNKIAYALFAILLGTVGAHKFYAGKFGMGVLFILFSWTGIPGVIGIIEGVFAIIKPEVEPGMIQV